MILIYSHKLTPRLKYIFKTVFTDVLQTETNFTNDVEFFENSEDIKINYSNSKLNTGIFIQCSSLLFESGIKEQNISIFNNNNNPCFFSVGKDSELPFDPFAASFYLISRYEEYLPHIKDQHERFLATESLAFQNNFLDTPLVNIWINEIATKIESHFKEFQFPKQSFKFISSIDIDNAYAYKHKSAVRTVGGLVKALIKGDNLVGRLKVIFGNEQDPFDTYEYQYNIHKKYNISPIYFFLLGDYGINDKNIHVKNRSFQSLIKSISDYSEVGIHPSYASNSNEVMLTTEIKRLQDITHRNTLKSRQHFLKLSLPITYRNLIDNDIQEDYTMGYAEKSGFRASFCHPYFFYDLDTEIETKLKLFPFAFMEATYQYYEKYTPEMTSLKIEELMKAVKEVQGTFISVWHNESLSDKGIWLGWKLIYEKMLKESHNKI